MLMTKFIIYFSFSQVRKEDKTVRRTVFNSVLGTLDLCIRQFVQGETYPGVSPVSFEFSKQDCFYFLHL